MLIKTICGLIHPDQGKVIVDGKVIGKDVDFPESIGAIIEAPGFLPSVSAYRNLSYLASLRGCIGRDEIRAAISFVGLNPDDKKAVGKYSLGMKQRLGLAQAIMEDPDILLLDEPMNGLDNDGVSEMRNYLLQLREKGKTILLISSSLFLASFIPLFSSIIFSTSSDSGLSIKYSQSSNLSFLFTSFL